MRKVLTVIALLTVSFTTAFAQKSDSADLHHTWILVVTPKTSKANLDSVSSAWKADGIALTFNTLKYKHGQLVQVRGSVKVSGKNISGTFSSEGLKSKSLEIKVINKSGIDIRSL